MSGSVFYASSFVRLVTLTLARKRSLPDDQAIKPEFPRWKSSPALLIGEHVRVGRPTHITARDLFASSSTVRSGVYDDAYLVSARITHVLKRRPLTPKLESGY